MNYDMMDAAITWYGGPDPIETFAADTFFHKVAMAAHRRFSELPAYESAIRLIPLAPGGKHPARGFLPSKHDDPMTVESIAALSVLYPDANVGIMSRRAPGAMFVMDCDEQGVIERYEQETGRKFPETYTTQTRPNTAPWKEHRIFTSTPYSCEWLPKQVTSVTRVAGYDLKGNGGDGYVAAAGSVRDGEPIVVLHDIPVAPIPDELVDWLVADIAAARTQKSEMIREQRAAEKAKREQEPSRPFAVARGDRMYATKSRIRTLKNLGFSDDATFAELSRQIIIGFENGDNFLRERSAWIRKLISTIPSLGVTTSLRNLTRHRRVRRSTAPLSSVRDRFSSFPSDATPSQARAHFCVRTRADRERVRRELHGHGYVYAGRGSHSGRWLRRLPSISPTDRHSVSRGLAPARRFSPNPLPNPYRIPGAPAALPHHRKVCMSIKGQSLQKVAGASFIHTQGGKSSATAAVSSTVGLFGPFPDIHRDDG
ncbi:MAG: bifunctional DNA primase/polymerase [Candidatus Sulfotelmatobacter sp.]